jgi:ribosomal protein L11 methyltransferase
MTDYWKYDLQCTQETAELLMAFLSEAPFDTFEETDAGLTAYCPAPVHDEHALAELLNSLHADFEFEWEKTFVPGQNWNAIWESNFQPVVVGDFCAIRADFHDPQPGVRWELVINPKMAFGTGHHETTWQCLAAMEHLPIKGTHLLDYGCGTGILAIMASKLGAAHIEAVDIEQESYLNTLENAEVNHVDNITVRCGTLETVLGRDFDGVLANINRNVIVPSFPVLADMMQSGAWLLVSGILAQDEEVVTSAAAQAGFIKTQQTQRGNWLCILFHKG